MMKHYTLKWSIDSKGHCLADALDSISGENGVIDIDLLNNCFLSSKRVQKGVYRLTLVTMVKSHSPTAAAESLIMQEGLKRATDVESLIFLVKESGESKWQRVQIKEEHHEFAKNKPANRVKAIASPVVMIAIVLSALIIFSLDLHG